MNLTRLELRGFRNYERFEFDLSPDVHLIVGDNAQGKTNLLEAIHYLSTLRSFRGPGSRELIRFGDPAAVLEGTVEGQVGRDVLRITLTPEGRKVTIDGKEPPSTADYLRILPSVKFTPDDILLLKGEGGPRRRALDRAVFGLDPTHYRHLLDYNRALKQKNSLLRGSANARTGVRQSSPEKPEGRTNPRESANAQTEFRGGGSAAQIEVWNERLAEEGARVVASRLEFVAKVNPLLGEFFGEISQSRSPAKVRYRGVLDQPAPIEEIREALLAELTRRAEEERARGHTVVGPHRDDLATEIGGRSVRRYASQGQHRMFALALKVAEIELHRRELGRYPVLLLDDVKSELDADRVRYLFDFLNRIPAQIFVTSTDLHELEGEVRRPRQVWRVEAGLARPV